MHTTAVQVKEWTPFGDHEHTSATPDGDVTYIAHIKATMKDDWELVLFPFDNQVGSTSDS